MNQLHYSGDCGSLRLSIPDSHHIFDSTCVIGDLHIKGDGIAVTLCVGSEVKGKIEVEGKDCTIYDDMLYSDRIVSDGERLRRAIEEVRDGVNC